MSIPDSFLSRFKQTMDTEIKESSDEPIHDENTEINKFASVPMVSSQTLEFTPDFKIDDLCPSSNLSKNNNPEKEINVSLGNLLFVQWKNRIFLNADAIDRSILKIIKAVKTDKKILFISSLAISAAVRRNDTPSIQKALGITKTKDYDIAVIIIHNETHWSCLIQEKTEDYDKLYHYDSIKKLNEELCKTLVWFLRDHGVISTRFKLLQPLFFFQKSYFECGYYCILAIYIAFMKNRDERRLVYLNEDTPFITDLFEELYLFLDQ